MEPTLLGLHEMLNYGLRGGSGCWGGGRPGACMGFMHGLRVHGFAHGLGVGLNVVVGARLKCSVAHSSGAAACSFHVLAADRVVVLLPAVLH